MMQSPSRSGLSEARGVGYTFASHDLRLPVQGVAGHRDLDQ